MPSLVTLLCAQFAVRIVPAKESLIFSVLSFIFIASAASIQSQCQCQGCHVQATMEASDSCGAHLAAGCSALPCSVLACLALFGSHSQLSALK